MWKKILPDRFAKDVFEIDPRELKKQGFDLVLLDIDNTIAKYEEPVPSEKIKNWVLSLKDAGLDTVIISNNRAKRVGKFGEELASKSFHFSLKPLKKNYKKIIKEYDIDPSKVCAIGDQLFMDVLGANRMGIYSILVDRIYDTGSFVRKWLMKFEDGVRHRHRHLKKEATKRDTGNKGKNNEIMPNRK